MWNIFNNKPAMEKRYPRFLRSDLGIVVKKNKWI